jgi:glycosyltransferase involved in cell wall biosynthesis
VRWIGTVTGRERDTLLQSAAAALFPIGWDEPGGTAVVESLALGTAPIGFRRGCLPELVDEGRTGLLVEPGDVDALAAAVSDVRLIDPRVCRREAARRFTPARMAQQYLDFYDQVIALGGRPVPVRSTAEV